MEEYMDETGADRQNPQGGKPESDNPGNPGPEDIRQDKQSWVMLIYRIPREPSRPRVAVWRKLQMLGALYLQDGVAVLPEDAVTHEQLEWLQVRIREAGGEATVWEARANTVPESSRLVEAFRSCREEAYWELIAEAEHIVRKAAMGGARNALLKQLAKLDRNFRTERRRDYFRSPTRCEASEALKAVRQAVREPAGEETGADVG